MINLVGQFFGSSGYAIHLRELANALNKLTDVRLSVNLVDNWHRLVNDKELEMLKRQPVKDEINLLITNPIFWRVHTDAKRNWTYLIWEGDRIPKSWIDECLNPDIEYIFVPSTHTMDAVLDTIKDPINQLLVSKKLMRLPHGVDLKKFYPKSVVPHEKKEDGTTTFLANKGFRNPEDRGGIQYLVQAFCREFTKKDNVELIIKINPAYPFAQNIIEKELAKYPNKPKITIVTEFLEYDKLVDFYNQGNVFVSPTRAEAFNLPILEAMACGLPAITTNFGGQTDYCDDDNSWIIGGELTEIKHELQYESVKWLTPNISELKKALRDAYNRPGLVKIRGENAILTAKTYTWDSTAKQITKLL